MWRGLLTGFSSGPAKGDDLRGLDCISSRSRSRALASRDITVPKGMSSSSAISR